MLYGLKQSGTAWYLGIDSFLRSIDLQQSKNDHNMYISLTDKNQYVILILYVDDIMLTGDAAEKLMELEIPLQTKYQIFAIGNPSLYIGLQFQYTNEGIFNFQERYAEQLLTKYNMRACNPSLTPMDEGIKLQSQMDSPAANKHAYQSLVGSLIFVTPSRPDISYSVSTLSKFMTSPLSIHMDTAKRVLHYLQGTTDYGILFPCNSALGLEAFLRQNPEG